MTREQLGHVYDNARRRCGLEGKPAGLGSANPAKAKQIKMACCVCGKPLELEDGPLRRFMPRRGVTCPECVQAEKARRRAEEAAQHEQARRAAQEAVRADPAAALAVVGVPALWRSVSLDGLPDLPSWIIDKGRQWAERPEGLLYFFGVTGCGKTCAAVAILHHVLTAGVPPVRAVRFIGERQYLDDLKRSFDKDAPPANPRTMPAKSVARILLLCLDDLASVRHTPWSAGEVCNLLEHRHAQGLPTILTGNLTPDELARGLDARAVSRIAESRSIIEFPSVDLRRSGHLRLAPSGPAWSGQKESSEQA